MKAKRNVGAEARHDIADDRVNLAATVSRAVKNAAFFELNDGIFLEGVHRRSLVFNDRAVAVGRMIGIVAEPNFIDRGPESESFKIAGAGRPALRIGKDLPSLRERVHVPFAVKVAVSVAREKEE